MRPYFEKGQVRELIQIIQKAVLEHGNMVPIAFASDVKPLRSLDEIDREPWGANTYLDRAIDHVIAKKYDTTWMITDNIQDEPNAPEAGNTEVFYRRLREDTVKKVIIFPLLQPPGMPGIVIYAVLLKPESREIFEKQLVEFLSGAKGKYTTEPLQMKPLDQDTIDINILKSTLQARKNKPYQEGEVIRESLELRFKSKFRHLKIVGAKIEVPKIEADFGPDSVLKPEKTELSITPTSVKSLPPEGETEEIYTATVDLGRVRMKRDFAAIWKAAFGQAKEKHTLKLTFLIHVPQKNFQFKDQLLRAYNAPSLALAKTTGKIYGIENLPALLTEETTAITVEKQIPLEVAYPWWPAVVLVIGLLVLLAIIGSVVWYVATHAHELIGRKKWKVRAATESGVSVPCEIADQGRVILQASEVGQIVGNEFVPANIATITDGGSDQKAVSLEEGLRLKLRLSRGNAFVLTFGTATEDGEDATYTPGRR